MSNGPVIHHWVAVTTCTYVLMLHVLGLGDMLEININCYKVTIREILVLVDFTPPQIFVGGKHSLSNPNSLSC